jgi:phosphomannomutase
MQMTVETTLSSMADIGVIFDTDVDRSGVVDGASGVGINRNRLIAILARIILREHPGTTIVTDSVTSNGLARFIETHGGKHLRYKKGYKNVIDKAIAMNADGIDTQLAIETSGHGACKENYMLDDGCYLAVKIIIEMVRLRLAGDKRGIGSLLDGLAEPLEEQEFRLTFHDKSDFGSYGRSCVEAFATFAASVDGWTVEQENYEGFRVRVDEGEGREGWLLLRPSLHDPLLALNIESEVAGGTERVASVLVDRFFPEWDNVDVSSLAARVAA